MSFQHKSLRLCLITNIGNTPIAAYSHFIKTAAQNGLTMLQLREKTAHNGRIKMLAHGL